MMWLDWVVVVTTGVGDDGYGGLWRYNMICAERCEKSVGSEG